MFQWGLSQQPLLGIGIVVSDLRLRRNARTSVRLQHKQPQC